MIVNAFPSCVGHLDAKAHPASLRISPQRHALSHSSQVEPLSMGRTPP